MKEKRILKTIDSLMSEDTDFKISTSIYINNRKIDSFNDMLIELNKHQKELKEKYLGVYRFIIKWHEGSSEFRLYIEEKKFFCFYKTMRRKYFAVNSNDTSKEYFNNFSEAFKEINSKSSVEKYRCAIKRDYR